MNAANFFSQEQKEDLKLAIKMAELDTSGEIRVHIEMNCAIDPKDRALAVFKHLKMHKTAQRNGVLVYLAVNSRKFAIIGDEGINKVVPEDFWEEIKSNMLVHFRIAEFTQGITSSIQMVGEKLKQHFPFHREDSNELSDEISFDNEELAKKDTQPVEHK